MRGAGATPADRADVPARAGDYAAPPSDDASTVNQTDSADLTGTRALLVDLNNFARFPTMAVGYLVAALRGAGGEVEVLSPLAHGAPPTERERPDTRLDDVRRRVAVSTHPLASGWISGLRNVVVDRRERPSRIVLDQARAAIDDRRPDVLLLSAYLDHAPSVAALGDLAARRGVPMLLGGPGFNEPRTAEEWRGTPGLTALVGAEVDRSLPRLVRAVLDGDDLATHTGVVLPDGRRGPPAPPLAELAGLPVPDYTDFPWERYPNRIIPMMTGRGCDWGRCLFCSDVTSVNGRTFRSRPVDDVLAELHELGRRHEARDTIFLDIKLNADLAMWRALLADYQRVLPGGRWVGTLHVGPGENGLSRDELEAAYASGLRRCTFGLESGSQRLNDAMVKGTDLDRMSRFVHDAHAAGISVRTTTMVGFPGERTEDLARTTAWLRAHGDVLDRVRLSRFKPTPGTRLEAVLDSNPARLPGLEGVVWDHRRARGVHTDPTTTRRDYRRAKSAMLDVVHGLNRRPLRDEAVAFDGLM